jgi:uncharacterized protein YlaI
MTNLTKACIKVHLHEVTFLRLFQHLANLEEDAIQWLNHLQDATIPNNSYICQDCKQQVKTRTSERKDWSIRVRSPVSSARKLAAYDSTMLLWDGSAPVYACIHAMKGAPKNTVERGTMILTSRMHPPISLLA